MIVSRSQGAGMEWRKAAAEADAIAQTWMTEGGPGGAVVLFDRQTICAEAYGGLASIEQDRPFGADTAVRYASISKHFLCALVARLDGIGFDDRLGSHLDLPPALAKVTVGRALDMTGGIPDAMETLWLLGVSPSTTLDRAVLLRFACGLDALNFPAGGEISYSNTGYRLVQAALEARGPDYRALLAEHFFHPLNLGIRLPEDESEPVPRLATGYWRAGDGWRRGRYGLHYSASGGLAGSARDLATWVQAIMAGSGPADGVLARLGALRHLADGRPTGYGLGLARASIGDGVAIGHGGSLPGFKNHFLMAPGLGAGVVVVSNREDTDAQALARRVLAALTSAAPPGPATDLLPEGRFVAEDGPFWLEQNNGVVDWLGAKQVLHRGADGTAAGDAAHLPIRLERVPGGIAGEIGHVARRFRPVPADLPAPAAWVGTWVCAAQDARFDIAVSGGVASLSGSVGPTRTTCTMQPMRADLALVDRDNGGPWRQRVAVQFDGDEARLVTNRSRVLRFRRG
jgi:CubicO group peptidase (beta-lactamase class C family)